MHVWFVCAKRRNTPQLKISLFGCMESSIECNVVEPNHRIVL